MPDAPDLRIKFPVKSAAATLPLVLPRRRPNSRAPFAPAAETEKAPPAIPPETTGLIAAQLEMNRVEAERLKEMEASLRDLEGRLSNQQRETAEKEQRLMQEEAANRVELDRLKGMEPALRERENRLSHQELEAAEMDKRLAQEAEANRLEAERIKGLEPVLRERESRLTHQEHEAAEKEKRLAQRERDLLQAEDTLTNAIEALQKIKPNLHARAD